ncbi:MAG: Glu/Leu/Phe/Val dehydrogenase [bacterium]|nr:Glu/Leu/Phe/Val dehydrogenase [bacterium]
MEIFNLMKENNQEQIAFYTDKSVKLRAILAIHSTALGPAMGGIRIYRYKSVEEAVSELLRLSRAMTYKTAASGLSFGGGQIVVVEQDGMERNEAFFRAMGRFIESFQGRFIAGEDIGVTEDSMEFIGMETKYIAGLPAYYEKGSSHSYMGAYGTFLGMLAAAKHKWGSDDISGKKIIVQGYGRIGSLVAALAAEKGANVTVTDIDPKIVEKAENDGFKTLPPENTVTEECDILSPCAVQAVITPETSEKFNCSIIAGAANNQLLNYNDDHNLKKKGILYAPDFIINAGTTIDISEEYLGYNKKKVQRKIENIYDRVLKIFKNADENDIPNNQAAIQFALNRIEAIKGINGTFRGKGHAYQSLCKRRRSD